MFLLIGYKVSSMPSQTAVTGTGARASARTGISAIRYDAVELPNQRLGKTRHRNSKSFCNLLNSKVIHPIVADIIYPNDAPITASGKGNGNE